MLIIQLYSLQWMIVNIIILHNTCLTYTGFYNPTNCASITQPDVIANLQSRFQYEQSTQSEILTKKIPMMLCLLAELAGCLTML